MKNRISLAKSTVLGMFLISGSVMADTPSSDEWQYGVVLYGWLPDVSGSIMSEVPTGLSRDGTIEFGDILDNLSMTFMGTIDARRGKFSMFADVLYLKLSNDKKFPIDLDQGSLEAKVSLASDSWVVTTAAGYKLVDSPKAQVDMIGGVRYLSAGFDTSVTILNKRTFSVSENIWDGIVGIRGNYSFSDQWYMPFYADIGTGDSDLTWQAMAGVGYRFGWGSLKFVYRHLAYKQSSDKLVQDLAVSGPAIGVAFSF
jgi:hypothetical protein